MNTIREQLPNSTLTRNVISGLGATRTLNANETDSLIILDRAAGIVVTLPTAAPGLEFEFMVSVTNTTPSYKIITSVGTELLVGQILGCDTDTSDAVAIWKSLVATSNIAVTMNGTTTGGIKGDKIKFTCLNATTWVVDGYVNSNGTVATPFATS